MNGKNVSASKRNAVATQIAECYKCYKFAEQTPLQIRLYLNVVQPVLFYPHGLSHIAYCADDLSTVTSNVWFHSITLAKR